MVKAVRIREADDFWYIFSSGLRFPAACIAIFLAHHQKMHIFDGYCEQA